ncbi:MAG: hypothetical protein KA116_05860 [Proteobacteria bacterium]|nr:hypothetical protein [Pseudomonadota bacterium]
MKFFNKKAFTIVQVLMVLFLGSLAFIMISELLKQVNVVSSRGREAASLASMQDMMAPLRNINSATDFIQKMRSGTSWFNGCLPATGTTYSCPASVNVSAYPELQAKVASNYVFESEILDLKGNKIAGTTSSPVYFNESGSPCTASDCTFKSLGFAIINSVSNPGNVTFANVIIQNPNGNSRGIIWKPRYTYFEIGNFWKASVTNDCLPGSYVSGIDSNLKVKCTTLPTPKLRKLYEQVFSFAETSGTLLLNDSSNPNAITLCTLSAVDDDTSMFADSDPVSSKTLSSGYKCELRKSGSQWLGVAPMPSGSVACLATCVVFEAYH